MRLHRPSALLLGATVVIGAVATPGLAFADGTTGTTTQTDVATVVAALKSAHTAAAAADHDGWSEHLKVVGATAADSLNAQLTYAVQQGRGYTAITGSPSVKLIEVQHTGDYVSTSSVAPAFGGSKRFKSILSAVGRPRASWIFEPDTSVDLTDPDDGFVAAAPDGLLATLVDPAETTVTGTPTQTVSADGSTTTYAFSGTDKTVSGSPSAQYTVTVDADDLMTATTETFSGETDSGTFSYGAQHIYLPTGSQFVTLDRLTEGLVLAQMGPEARRIATTTQHEVAKKPHRAAATADLVRRIAKAVAREHNRGDKHRIFTTVGIRGGARITATDRFTHRKVSFTVTAHGKRTVLHRR